MLNTKAWVGIFLVAITGILWYFVGSPWWMEYSIGTALSEGNRGALQSYLDTESASRHIRDRLQNQLQEGVTATGHYNKLLSMGPAMGGVLVDRYSAEYGNSSFILNSLVMGHPSFQENGGPSSHRTAPTTAREGMQIVLFEFQGPPPMKMVVSRRGLGWKITDLRFDLP